MSEKDEFVLPDNMLSIIKVVFEKLGMDQNEVFDDEHLERVICGLVAAIVNMQKIEEVLFVHGRHLNFCPLYIEGKGQQCACGFDLRKSTAKEAMVLVYGILDGSIIVLEKD